ncbi:MAG: hypothetical protein LCH38_10110 [Proteobacteria bacterium]|nr:hypothetical protein [Pseudomonadota bacterium]
MDDFLARFSGEGGMLRRYLVACTALIVLGVIAGQGLAALLENGQAGQPIPDIAKAGATRHYTLTRSVLDAPTTTASIPQPAGQRVDPCRN